MSWIQRLLNRVQEFLRDEVGSGQSYESKERPLTIIRPALKRAGRFFLSNIS
jgi:hypothetical protein